MGFNRPSDIVFIFGIFALVMLTVGYGITSVVDKQNISTDTSYFTNLNGQLNNYQNTTGTMTGAVTPQEGQSEESSEESILVRGFNSILSMGEIFTLINQNLEAISTKLGIPSAFIIIISGMIIITFAVVTYSWLRGANL